MERQATFLLGILCAIVCQFLTDRKMLQHTESKQNTLIININIHRVNKSTIYNGAYFFRSATT